MNKAAFMGRNGLIHTMPKGGLLNIADCRMLEGVASALNLLGQNGYILNVITNEKGPQPGGIDYLNIVGRVAIWIKDMIYSPIYFGYCHHHHAKKCLCRLPKPGLIESMVEKHNIDITQSIMFASSMQEIKAAEAASIENIIRISTGKADWKDDNQYPLYDNLLASVKELIANG